MARVDRPELDFRGSGGGGGSVSNGGGMFIFSKLADFFIGFGLLPAVTSAAHRRRRCALSKPSTACHLGLEWRDEVRNRLRALNL